MLLFAEMKAPTVSGQHNRLSPVGTGNCTLLYFCDSRQGEKKVSRLSFRRVGRVTGNKNFFFLALPETFPIRRKIPIYKVNFPDLTKNCDIFIPKFCYFFSQIHWYQKFPKKVRKSTVIQLHVMRKLPVKAILVMHKIG